ncbi:MAG TPA: exodeoxyribonuclease VII large subunit [Longimicrobiales bacterium]|nr:exodeoxyribonuclease VII large subunit [Longimicrobiales bacterium]
MTLDLFGRATPGRRSQARRARTEALVPGKSRDSPLSPSTLNALAREVLETGFPALWIGGEVTNWRRAQSGHCYFTLRDSAALLPCVMFSTQASRLPAEPEDGMEVRALGALTLYEARGSYQLRVEVLEAAGRDGLWRLAFERLRTRLHAEGLLAVSRKRPLPRCPRRVGIVTSPLGAALQDILRVVEERAPWTEVVFCPARVQGEGAAQTIALALGRVGRAPGVEVVIVGRGGGSTEDLWAFNEEVVARAIAACPVPVVSAVGHEVDLTIADLVADVRAPTPSAAGEITVPDRASLEREVADARRRLARALRLHLDVRTRRLERLAERADRALARRLSHRMERLRRLSAQLHALSPLAALGRGYAVPLAPDGHVLRAVEEFRPGLRFGLRVTDGTVPCRVEDT